jgi:prephenate dehydrogenase
MGSSRDVAILGYGRFGRALGDLLVDAGMSFAALDPVAEVPAPHRADTLRSLVEGARFVVVSVPVPRIPAALRDMLPLLSPSQIVLDVGSVKVRPVEAMREVLGTRIPWVGTHPLFGPLSLALAERPLRVVVCAAAEHPQAAADVRALYQKVGCELVDQTAESHDRIMAHTHALTFFIAKGMVDAGAGMEVPFAPASFQGIARTIETVRSDAGHLFAAIQKENPFATEARQHLLESLSAIHRTLENAPLRVDADAPPDSTRLAIPDLGTRSPELKEAREHIDAVDKEILQLLARRAQLSQRAAKAKAALGHPVRDEAREAELFAARRTWAKDAGLDVEGVEDIFRAVVRSSRRVQR